MGFKKTTKTATTDTAVTAAAERNEPIGIALNQYEGDVANMATADMDIDYALLTPSLKTAIDRLLAKFGVESKGDDAVVFKYKAEKQQLQGPIALAHGDGMIVRMGDYGFMIAADADITEKPYSFNFSADHGGTLILDRGGVNLEARVFFDRKQDTKNTNFAARMMSVSTAGQLSEFLARGEALRKWSDEPEKTTYTVHDIMPVPDREDETKIAYAYLLVETADGQPARTYAPGAYEDYAGIEFPASATKDGYTFTIGGKDLPISSGGSYCKLHELEVGVEYKVVGFVGAVNKFGNWQATLTLEDGRKVNGNKAINQRMQGKPDDCIAADQPGTLTVLNIDTVVSNKDGKTRNYVTAKIQLASDNENPLLEKLQARLKAAQQQKQPATVGNPL